MRIFSDAFELGGGIQFHAIEEVIGKTAPIHMSCFSISALLFFAMLIANIASAFAAGGNMMDYFLPMPFQ
jgi:hypothetical protein